MTLRVHHDAAELVAAHHTKTSGMTRIGYPIGVRDVRVTRREFVSPRMLRLTLAGPEVRDMHTYHADDHLALVFPDLDGLVRMPLPNAAGGLDWPRPTPPNRKYTIRRIDRDAGELDLDIVVHARGLASGWAEGAKVGAAIVAAGPPGAKAFGYGYDHFVLAVDATGLPAVARWLEEAPAGRRVDIVVETAEPCEHEYPLPDYPGASVTRLVRDGGGPGGSRLASTVGGLPLVAGESFVFAAGEANDVKPIRSLEPRDVDRFVTGYWKRGVRGFD